VIAAAEFQQFEIGGRQALEEFNAAEDNLQIVKERCGQALWKRLSYSN